MEARNIWRRCAPSVLPLVAALSDRVKADLKLLGINDGVTRALDKEARRGIAEAAMGLNDPK